MKIFTESSLRALLSKLYDWGASWANMLTITDKSDVQNDNNIRILRYPDGTPRMVWASNALIADLRSGWVRGTIDPTLPDDAVVIYSPRVLKSECADTKGNIEYDLGKVVSTRLMFNESEVNTLDLSNFDTSDVTTMFRMFSKCVKLTTLDLSSFDTSNCTTMACMFANCTSLTSLDLSSFDTSNVTNMSDMFNRCSGLTELNLGDTFNAGNVSDMENMFDDCTTLQKVTGTITGINCSLNLSACPLTPESAMVFIDGLKDLTGQSAKQLTLSKTTYNSLTSDQLAAATGKNWTVVSK